MLSRTSEVLRAVVLWVLLPGLLVALAWSLATKKAQDPAVAACEALARDVVGSHFVAERSTLFDRTVSISYKMDPASASSELHDFTCAFQLETSTGQWTIDRGPTPDAVRCSRVSTWDIPPEWRAQRAMKAALEKCNIAMKIEEVRVARLPVVEQQLRQSGGYPIKQQDTGLKAAELRGQHRNSHFSSP